MLHKKTISSDDLIKNLNGTVRAEGAAGGGTSGDATWTDASATFQTDNVAEGDVVYIDGEGEFTVASITSETILELSATLSQDLSSTSWRITYSRLTAWADVQHLFRDPKTGRFTVIYESDDFTVSS
tara:strand:- start:1865 stop:2245 length:381 start_codon:yes stop_codon:yes gene_type:complete